MFVCDSDQFGFGFLLTTTRDTVEGTNPLSSIEEHDQTATFVCVGVCVCVVHEEHDRLLQHALQLPGSAGEQSFLEACPLVAGG